ncbi:ATP-binding cassette domain-containing protein, partial [bacterium]|nr:ATP-binding cassette domain-containing protein [bacterium]
IPNSSNIFQTQKKIIQDTTSRDEELILDAFHIKKHYQVERGFANLLRHNPSVLHAVDGITIQIKRGSTVGMVGESGCGKTTFARCIAGLEKPTEGEISLSGNILADTVNERPLNVLKKIQMVFQNPDDSLNPQHPVGVSVSRPLYLAGQVSKGEIDEQVKALFLSVNLPEDYITRLPHELSGGEKQRVAIARAFSAEPTLIILDEPISSLDVSVQASIMNLLIKLQDSEETSFLFISHDLAVVRHLSDQIAVVYLGKLWEIGLADEVFAPPSHPYTEALLSAIPTPFHNENTEPIRLHGRLPSSVNLPSGCRFHTRCPRKFDKICEVEEPPWQKESTGHYIRCHIPIDELTNIQQYHNMVTFKTNEEF